MFGMGAMPFKGRRTREKYLSWQIGLLEAVFKEDRFPPADIRDQLAIELGIAERCVRVWFQNRRQRHRKAASLGGCDSSYPEADMEQEATGAINDGGSDDDSRSGKTADGGAASHEADAEAAAAKAAGAARSADNAPAPSDEDAGAGVAEAVEEAARPSSKSGAPEALGDAPPDVAKPGIAVSLVTELAKQFRPKSVVAERARAQPHMQPQLASYMTAGEMGGLVHVQRHGAHVIPAAMHAGAYGGHDGCYQGGAGLAVPSAPHGPVYAHQAMAPAQMLCGGGGGSAHPQYIVSNGACYQLISTSDSSPAMRHGLSSPSVGGGGGGSHPQMGAGRYSAAPSTHAMQHYAHEFGQAISHLSPHCATAHVGMHPAAHELGGGGGAYVGLPMHAQQQHHHCCHQMHGGATSAAQMAPPHAGFSGGGAISATHAAAEAGAQHAHLAHEPSSHDCFNGGAFAQPGTVHVHIHDNNGAYGGNTCAAEGARGRASF